MKQLKEDWFSISNNENEVFDQYTGDAKERRFIVNEDIMKDTEKELKESKTSKKISSKT
jgi:hypothetical protein